MAIQYDKQSGKPKSLYSGATLGPLRTKVKKDLAKAFGNKTGAIPAYLRNK